MGKRRKVVLFVVLAACLVLLSVAMIVKKSEKSAHTMKSLDQWIAEEREAGRCILDGEPLEEHRFGNFPEPDRRKEDPREVFLEWIEQHG